MSLSLDDQKKAILPFAQRAQEVEKAEPKVAYYCRMYALTQGLELPRESRAKEIGAVLGALMDRLEHDKKVVKLGKPEDDALYCENFALTVFNRADRVDRAGRADKNTAMTYYAASYFFEILRQFGEPQPDTLQKQKYAAWRAADISKAVKEGRQPDPPPSASQAEVDEESAMLDELSKLELASTSSAPSSLPSMPIPPPAPAASGRLSGLLPMDDWGAPSPPAQGPPPGAYPAQPPPPAAEDDGELRLPSPPKQRPVDSRPPAGEVWAPPPLRRFQTFQKVLFCPEGSTAPARGTIAKVEEGMHPERPTYLVALPDRIATVDDTALLAPDLATGEAVLYHAPSGHTVQATVAEIDIGHWPPSYLVRLADGSYVDTTDSRLQQVNVPRPRSEAANLDSLAALGSPAGTPAGGGGGGGMYPPPAVGMPPAPPAAAAQPPMPPPPAAAAPRRGTMASPARAAAPPPPPVALPQAVAGFQPGLREITEASKLTKSAASALQFEDVTTAVKLLSESLRLLTQPR
ncbi:hypothetical protein D9Q98_010141 [Chlorella vulgaris]|uniref:Uncharacterized protein n=1 Tax=Chlorella vulgaris TaxID=3077 RepID=A0A9D4TMU8_CHLVU|nr:hypothetical protein D9Q98_010141 [Chlorella vulgaris]